MDMDAIKIIQTAFIVITGVATSIISAPIMKAGWIGFKRWRWKRNIRTKQGENEDDNKHYFIYEKAKEYFEPKWTTHEVCGFMSVEAENDGKSEKEKLLSSGYIITIEFNRFKKFVKDIMKDYEEDSYIEWVTDFNCRAFHYYDKKEGVIRTLFRYKDEKFGSNSRKVVDLYTDPVRLEGADDMRGLFI